MENIKKILLKKLEDKFNINFEKIGAKDSKNKTEYNSFMSDDRTWLICEPNQHIIPEPKSIASIRLHMVRMKEMFEIIKFLDLGCEIFHIDIIEDKKGGKLLEFVFNDVKVTLASQLGESRIGKEDEEDDE